MSAEEEKQVKSRERVIDHGEVFTNPREVNAMLDLVKSETQRIDSRFLEPACGDGNFLAEILRRKLRIVSSSYPSSQSNWELAGAVSISSIYGIEILEDNAEECRDRLFQIFTKEFYEEKFRKTSNEKYEEIIKYLLKKNIVCGDALSLLDSNKKPIVFPEWSFIGYKVQRRDYTFSGLLNDSKQSLMRNVPYKQRKVGQASIFDNESDDDFEDAGLIKDRKYPLINFMELGTAYD